MDKPQILYKYRNICDNTEKILSEQKVWLSKPENLNDPFECSIANYSEKVKEQLTKMFKSEKVAMFCIQCQRSIDNGNSLFGLKRKALKVLLKKMATKSIDRQYKMLNDIIHNEFGFYLSSAHQLFKGFEDRLSSSGIFSLSATDTNQLMWAHYGGEHRGIAIGFELIDGCKLANDNYCFPINYCDDVPKFNPEELTTQSIMKFGGDNPNIKLKIPFDDPIFRKCISTKPIDWEYEKEWRYIEESDGLYPFPGKLSEIIFGLRCSDADRRKYMKLADTHFEYPIRFYEIVKRPNSNQIEKKLLIIK